MTINPDETQKIEDILAQIKEQIKIHPNRNRVFFQADENHFIKAIPGNCNIGDYWEFQRKMEELDKYLDGFISYSFHTHENGDHLVHKLDVLLHRQGYKRLVNEEVLY